MPSRTSPSRAAIIICLLVGILAASTAAIFIRFAQFEGAASIVVATARLTIASLLLAPFALTKNRSDLRCLGYKDWLLTLLSGLFLALHFASWITSLEFTSVASSVVFVSTTPLWVALLSPLVLHERIKNLALLGLALALIGGVIIGISDICIRQIDGISCPPIDILISERAFLGDSLALAGAWMAAGYLLVGRKLRARLPLVPYIFIVYGMAALVLLILMISLGKTPFGLPLIAYLWFVLLAIIPQLIGHSIFNWALRYIPASFVSITLLGEPIGSTVFAFVIFQETPGWIKIGGAIILLFGIWLAGKSELSQA